MTGAAKLAAAAALLLAGCSDPGDTRSQGAKDRAAARLVAVEARPNGLAAVLIGRWATDRSCADAVVYAVDGSLDLHADPPGLSPARRWSAAGDRVTWTGPDGSSAFRVIEIEANSHIAIAGDGRRERYVRC